MRKLKYVKLFENLIFENLKLNQKCKFYHKSPLKNLQSLLSGIDPKTDGSIHSKSQGGGFYCFSDFDVCKNWSSKIQQIDKNGKLVFNPSDSIKDGFVIIEFETELNINNFEIDYELGFRHETNKMMNTGQYFSKIMDIVKSKNYILYLVEWDDDINIDNMIKIDDNFKFNWNQLIIISEKKLSKDEINLTGDVNQPYPSNKNLSWIFISPAGGGDKNVEYLSMESLDLIGLKDEIKKQVLDKCVAFKYIGPKIKPTRYMIEKIGELGDWIENN